MSALNYFIVPTIDGLVIGLDSLVGGHAGTPPRQLVYLPSWAATKGPHRVKHTPEVSPLFLGRKKEFPIILHLNMCALNFFVTSNNHTLM